MFLSLAIWVPIFAGLLVLAVGTNAGDDRKAGLQRTIALAGAVAGFLVTIPLYTGFHLQGAGMQFVEKTGLDSALQHPLPPRRGRHFDAVHPAERVHHSAGGDRGLDASSSSASGSTWPRSSIMSGLLNGVFAALDGMLFYVFFEATLIPMFIIIGVWGGANRVYAALKFFLYTFLGSVLMLVSLLYLYNKSGGSFAIQDWWTLPLSLDAQMWLFFGLLFAFAVKVPMWPVHTWLPDAHVEAPTGGSVVLAAIMLKLGAYGFVRFSLPILPDASRELAWLMIALSLIAVVYIGLVALVQTDMKKLIAYSSISHMGFVTLGFFIFNSYGIEGALVQMISHGFVSAAMFLCVGVMYDRMHTPQHRRLRRRGEHHAQVRRPDDAVRHGQLRPAGDQRLRRRVHGDHGRDEGQFLARLRGRHDAHLRRGLHAVDVQAGDLRRGRERTGRRLEGFEFKGIRWYWALLAIAVLFMGI